MAFQMGDKYYDEDYESGEIVEISKFAYDNMRYWRTVVESKINPSMKIKGAISVIGTMSDGEECDYRNLWNESDPPTQ